MRRFFTSYKNIAQSTITITDSKQIHHLKNVLRLKANDQLIIFNERQEEYLARIDKISNQSIILKIQKKFNSTAPKKTQLTIACAIPKKSKMDEIIDKLTQLGVDRIIPLNTERVIVKLDTQKEQLKLKRWRKIALNAAQQSQRKSFPVIDSIKELSEVLSESSNFDLKLIPTLSGKRKSLKQILTGTKPQNILVLIGPEGDFTEAEVKQAINFGFIPLSLGNLVLRVDTAAIAVASFIMLR